MYCPVCGTIQKENTKFCGYCGHEVKAAGGEERVSVLFSYQSAGSIRIAIDGAETFPVTAAGTSKDLSLGVHRLAVWNEEGRQILAACLNVTGEGKVLFDGTSGKRKQLRIRTYFTVSSALKKETSQEEIIDIAAGKTKLPAGELVFVDDSFSFRLYPNEKVRLYLAGHVPHTVYFTKAEQLCKISAYTEGCLLREGKKQLKVITKAEMEEIKASAYREILPVQGLKGIIEAGNAKGALRGEKICFLIGTYGLYQQLTDGVFIPCPYYRMASMKYTIRFFTGTLHISLLDSDSSLMTSENPNYRKGADGEGRLSFNVQRYTNKSGHFYGLTQEELTYMRQRIGELSVENASFSRPQAEKEKEGQQDSLVDVKKELDMVVGVEGAKAYLKKIEANWMLQERRRAQGLEAPAIPLNAAFAGNHGTGKAMMARLVAKYLKALGLLSKGQMVELSMTDLAAKILNRESYLEDRLQEASGGIFFIDGIGAMSNGEGGFGLFGNAAVNTLIKVLRKRRDDLVVILNGEEKEIEQLFISYPALKACFPNIVHFKDYTPDEMVKIMEVMARKNGYTLASGVKNDLLQLFMEYQKRGAQPGGNGAFVKGLLDAAVLHQAERLAENPNLPLEILTAADFNLGDRKSDRELEKVKKELNSIMGLTKVKEYMKTLDMNLTIQQRRRAQGFKTADISLHMIFTGNPGTGKTTMARIMAEYLKALGILSKGQLVEVSRPDLVAEYVGQTAPKTEKVIQSALGGVLFIDEAYSLARKDDNYGQEVIDTLVKEMEDHRDDLVVILAGYEKEMKDFLKANSGLKSRFPNIVHFDDYTPEEMYRILEITAGNKQYRLAGDMKERLLDQFTISQHPGRNDNGNGRLVRNMLEAAILRQSKRLTAHPEAPIDLLTASDFGLSPENESFDLEKVLSGIVGLEPVKDFVRSLSARLQVQVMQKKAGLPVSSSQTLHLIFEGNPGTGKTTVARIIADVLYQIHVIRTNKLVETDRSGLVAGYTGQTALKTKEVIDSALDGVLFIDEAYSLAQGGPTDFGREAIDTLVKAMEDNRDRLVVILAGYPENMQNFLDTNPGLTSRFSEIIHFPDYTLDELLEIAHRMYVQQGYHLTPEAETRLAQLLDTARKEPDFGNGRYVRTLFEHSLNQQALRLVREGKTDAESLAAICGEDLKE